MEFFPGAFEREWERRRAALLHELQIEQTFEPDWDWRKRGGGAVLPAVNPGGGWHPSVQPALRAGRGAARPMRTRFDALARGSQPAVVKLASYGGGGRVAAMINYAAREGQISVENERGELVSGKDELAGLRDDWEHLFDNRADSRDVAVFNVTVGHVSFDGCDRDAVTREILQAGFGDRRFVFAVEERAGDQVTVRGVVVLRGRSGERLTGDAKAAEIVQRRFGESDFGSGFDAHFRFQGYGNGVRFATSRVRDLVERFDGEVRDETGRLISTQEGAGDLVQRDWRHEMHSRKGRDVMHLIVSARASTNPAAFRDAVRDFLGEQFAGHRYVFTVHDPSGDPKEMAKGGKRPHIHAHAIVTMRSEADDRIFTSPQVFREWRALMAEKAREHGIDMELTDRRDQASPAAYTRNQVRPVSYAGRTEHEGTSEVAQARYDAKRNNAETSVKAERSLSYVAAAAATWRELIANVEDKQITGYAAQQINRIMFASREADKSAEKRPSAFLEISNMVMLQTPAEIEKAAMRQMTRPEFEAYEKRVETALSRVEQSLDESERRDFEQVAAAAREVVSIRREYLELSERERTDTTREDHNWEGDDRNGRSPRTKPESREALEARRVGIEPGYDGADSAASEKAARYARDAALGHAVISRINDVAQELQEARSQGLDTARLEQKLAEGFETAGELGASGNRMLWAVAENWPELKTAINDAIEQIDRDDAAVALDEVQYRRDNIRLVEDPRYAARFFGQRSIGDDDWIAQIDAAAERLSLNDALERAGQLGVSGNQFVRQAAERDPELKMIMERLEAVHGADPPQQQVQRLQELERDIEERHQGLPDDRER